MGTRTVRVLWIAWASLALAIAAPLATTRGHPPGLVFVPFVAAAWLVGHLLILALGRIGRRLAASRPETGAVTVRPTALRIGITLVGIAFLGATAFVLFLTGSLALRHERAGVLGALVLGAAAGTCAVHGAVLTGVIAGRPWAVPALRWTVVAWGLWFVWMMIAGALDGRPIVAVTGCGGLALMSWLFLALRPSDGGAGGGVP